MWYFVWPLVWSQSLLEKVASSYHPSKCSFQSWIIKLSLLQPSVLSTNIFFALTQNCALNYTNEIILSDFFLKNSGWYSSTIERVERAQEINSIWSVKRKVHFRFGWATAFPFFFILLSTLYTNLTDSSPLHLASQKSLSSTKYHFISPEILVFALQFSGISRISTISTDC